MRFQSLTVRFSTVLAIFFSVFIGAFILIQSSAAAQGIIDGLTLCTQIIIPSMFILMVLCIFIVKAGIAQNIGRLLRPIVRLLFHLPGSAGTVLLMSFIGGYPVGARSTYELYKTGAITKQQAKRLSLIAVGAGPAFVVSAVGEGMLKNRNAGLLLLYVHIASSLILGIVSGFIWKLEDKKKPQESANGGAAKIPLPQKRNISGTIQSIMNDFVDSTASAARSIFHICVFVTLFSGILGIISSLRISSHMHFLLQCILEVTAGCAAAAKSGNLPMIAAVLGFSGLSIIFQIASASREIMPNLPLFLLYRLLHALLSAVLILPFAEFFPVSAQVFSSNPTMLSPAYSSSVPASVALVIMCLALLSNVGRKQLDTGR